MTEQLEILITVILYTLFFAWIGYQRGSLREAIVAITATLGWIVIQQGGDLLVRIVNLGSKFLAFVRAGGLGADPDSAFPALSNAAPWVTADQRDEFLFIVWVMLLVFAYILSNIKPLAKSSKSDAWAILLGVYNGLLFAAILLPKLATIVRPADAIAGEPGGIRNVFDVLGGGLTLLRDNVGGLWGLFDPGQRSLVLLVLLTIFLLLAASTIRGSAKKPERRDKKRINLGKPRSAE